jgi:hypothetical protein
MHIIPHNLLSDEHMWAHSCCLTPSHRSRTGTTGWGAWRLLRCVRERSRLSSPSQLWVAGSFSPYDVIIYLFCTELLLYSKVVTFASVPWFIICVRLGSSTPSDYVRAQVPKTRVWQWSPPNPIVPLPSPQRRWGPISPVVVWLLSFASQDLFHGARGCPSPRWDGPWKGVLAYLYAWAPIRRGGYRWILPGFLANNPRYERRWVMGLTRWPHLPVSKPLLARMCAIDGDGPHVCGCARVCVNGKEARAGRQWLDGVLRGLVLGWHEGMVGWLAGPTRELLFYFFSFISLFSILISRFQIKVKYTLTVECIIKKSPAW